MSPYVRQAVPPSREVECAALAEQDGGCFRNKVQGPARAATHVFRDDPWQSPDRSTHHEGVSQIA
jgi:hypothetical protein